MNGTKKDLDKFGVMNWKMNVYDHEQWTAVFVVVKKTLEGYCLPERRIRE